MSNFTTNNSLLCGSKDPKILIWDASGSPPLDNGSGSWNATGGTNWVYGSTYRSWIDGSIAVFGNGGYGPANSFDIGVGSNIKCGGIIFNDHVCDGCVITLNNGSINLIGSSPILTTNGVLNNIINSVLTGSSLIKNGSGKLSLGGANTLTGNFTINSGIVFVTLSVNNNNPTATSLGNMTISGRTISINSGSTLQFNVPDAIGSYNYLTPVTLIADGGTITRISNTTTFNSIGSIILKNGGRLRTTNGNASTVGSFAINGSVTVSGTSGSYIDTAVGQNTNNGINLGTITGSTTFDVGSTGDPIADLTVSAKLDNKVLGGAASIIKNGTGKMLITSNSVFSGNTTINNGILKISGGMLYQAAYNNTAVVTINSGATLELDSFGYNASGSLGQLSNYGSRRILAGGTINIVGSSHSTSNNFQVANGSSGTLSMLTAGQTLTLTDSNVDNIRIGGVLTFAGNGNFVLNETIQDLTNSGSIIKNGNGSLDINYTMGYTGQTTINGGTCNINIANALVYSSSLILNSGTTTNISASNWWVGGHGTIVPSSRTITLNNSILLFTASGQSRIGNVILNNGSTLTSNRGLGSFDILLANVDTGAATLSVTGSAASTMNGSGGIHLQGIQNFNVSDVTGNNSADLIVDMVLGDPGSIGGSAGGINKLGLGTMSLLKANTYSGGTTINAGTIIINNSSALGTGAITVNSGGTLNLNGFTISNTIINNGGTIIN